MIKEYKIFRGEDGGQIDVGRDYCIPSTFRDEHQFMSTYFALQLRLGNRHRLIRLDSIAPPQRSCIL